MKISRIIKLVIIVGIIFGAWYFRSAIYSPINAADTSNVSFTIKSGSNLNMVLEGLEENGLIKCQLCIKTWAKVKGYDTSIIAGRYDLNKSMNTVEIFENISKVGSSEATITIQEGLTINQIEDKLVLLEVIEDGEFEQAIKDFNSYEDYWFLSPEIQKELDLPLEGYLYPDTYFIDTVNFNTDSFIILLLNNFQKKIETVKALTDSSGRSMHDVITMASILQREVRTPQDFELIAGILWKRLDSNWHIGADATILYITKKNTISASDLKLDDPYNTRLHTGMPPGPISNPDIEHIKATMNPKDSDYWYYLTTLDTGEVKYARNNDEHNLNKAKYL